MIFRGYSLMIYICVPDGLIWLKRAKFKESLTKEAGNMSSQTCLIYYIECHLLVLLNLLSFLRVIGLNLMGSLKGLTLSEKGSGPVCIKPVK